MVRRMVCGTSTEWGLVHNPPIGQGGGHSDIGGGQDTAGPRRQVGGNRDACPLGRCMGRIWTVCEVVPPGAGPTSAPTHRVEVVVCSRQGSWPPPLSRLGSLGLSKLGSLGGSRTGVVRERCMRAPVGRGAVYARTGGSGTPSLIGGCDNASRVIKYVAVLAYRYSGVDLMGMRVHDIRVVADLTRHDPTAPDPDEPVGDDGTVTGQTAQAKTLAESLFETVQEYLTVYWTGWWPTLHSLITFSPVPEVNMCLHFSIDILGSFQVHPDGMIDLFQPLLLRYAAGTQDPLTVFRAAVDDAFEYLLGPGGIPWLVAELLERAMAAAALSAETGLGSALFVVLAISFATAIFLGAARVVTDTINGVLRPLTAAVVLIFMGFLCLCDSIVTLAEAVRLNSPVEMDYFEYIETRLHSDEEINRARQVVSNVVVAGIVMVAAVGLFASAIGVLSWCYLNGMDLV